MKKETKGTTNNGELKGEKGRGERREEVVWENRLCISVPEAAAALGISRNLAYELVRRGELPVLRLGKRELIPRAALQRMLERCGEI